MRELVRNFVTKLKEIIKSFSEAFEEAKKSEMDEKVTSEMDEKVTSEMEEEVTNEMEAEYNKKLIAYMCIFVIFLLISNFITKFSVASPSEQEWLKKIINSSLVLIIPISFSSLLKLKNEIMSLIKMFMAFIILVAMAIGLALLVNYAMTVDWDPIFSLFSLISHMF